MSYKSIGFTIHTEDGADITQEIGDATGFGVVESAVGEPGPFVIPFTIDVASEVLRIAEKFKNAATNRGFHPIITINFVQLRETSNEVISRFSGKVEWL